jgi:catechol 2,3-dioxygenase-like lactoylglutathione lyase family enzyme
MSFSAPDGLIIRNPTAGGPKMAQTATPISQVGTVFVPVADQDRALEFYVGKLGFEQRGDFAYGEGSRWVEVAPPGSAIAIALVPPSEGGAPGGDETCCALATGDIDAAHETLRARGVEVDADVARDGRPRHLLFATDRRMGNATVPPMFFFRDVDGNRFLIVEAG